MKDAKCRICRRAGVKLFLKGDKCFSTKCPIIIKPYPPGQRKKRRTRPLSEYGKELKEKQKLKNWYNLGERQFSKYVKDALGARGRIENAEVFLIKTLESRLDNVIFRLGLAPSRSSARQIISHRHLLINDKPINIASYLVKKGDKINIKPNSLKKGVFQNLTISLKKYKPPTWLELDVEKLQGKIVAEPNLEEAAPPAEISSIFEFYSK